MKKGLFYLPSLLTIIVVLMLDEGWAKSLLLAVLVISVVIAKFKRNKLVTEEVEYDERVNTNIRYWSFGFVVVMNALLIVYLMLVSQSVISDFITIEGLMIYLSATLLIALYVVPSIAKILVGGLNMNFDLLIVGGILLILGFLVGVKKQTWLLSGFNEKRVADKNKLSILVGGFNGIMSILFLAAGVLSFQYVQGLFALLIIGYIALIIYTNVKMVE